MNRIKALYHQRLNTVMATRARTDLSGSATVFAPHPDDETLGCGGTILRKRAAGAAVKIVFMTDGRGSHRRFMDGAALGKRRQHEALAAASALGVPAEDVTFLGLEDGQLDAHFEAVCDRIQDLLRAHNPDEIYVTHPKEPHRDHAVLYEGAIAATKQLSNPPAIYAYPVWYWRQWPWTQIAASSKKETLRIVQTTLTNRLGAGTFNEFQQAVHVADVLTQKRAALRCHASQMQRFEKNPSWPILSDVSGGDFLACFFQPYEMFYTPSLCA